MSSLGGSTFVWRGIDQDYNFIETLDCLYELCDQVSVAVGGPDGTPEKVFDWARTKKKGKVLITYISPGEWASQVGREKLSYFSNLAIEKLGTDWNFYLQCDEIIHEDSFPAIRYAITQEQVRAYFCRRLNLWRDPWHMLNVPQERKPCSTEVIRLARREYRCVDDAESLGVDSVHIPGDIDNILIYHMGFVRDEVKHLEKIRHMQVEVFLWGDFDVKAKDCDRLMPDRWFDPEKDLVEIPRPLPKFIQKWAEERYPNTLSLESTPSA
jgi:hypothetical protein